MTIVYVLIILVWVWFIIYNGIIQAHNSVLESKSTIEVMFQNRYDLITNLVSTVKGYMKHEKEMLEEITKIRTQMLSQKQFTKEKLQSEDMLSSKLWGVFALAEAYPDLKADSLFRNLQTEWVEMETNIQAARRWYNAAVKELKNKKQQVPSNIVAMTMWLPDYNMFQAQVSARNNINAQDLLSK